MEVLHCTKRIPYLALPPPKKFGAGLRSGYLAPPKSSFKYLFFNHLCLGLLGVKILDN